MNCGIWRYHPILKAFEVVASGTTSELKSDQALEDAFLALTYGAD